MDNQQERKACQVAELSDQILEEVIGGASTTNSVMMSFAQRKQGKSCDSTEIFEDDIPLGGALDGTVKKSGRLCRTMRVRSRSRD